MQRFSIGDAAELAGDVGPDPRLIGVLAELDGAIDLPRLRDQVAGRAERHPILSHRFVRHGQATWSAAWEQVPIDIADHVFEMTADDPVAAAVGVMATALPEAIPMWRLVVLLSPGGTQLLFVAHHTLLDGATAVAVVGSLLGVELAPPSAEPVGVERPEPARVEQRAKVAPSSAPLPRRRWTVAPSPLAALTRGSSATSLLTPLTSGFRLTSVEIELVSLHAAARRAGATVNDVLLVAVADAVRAAATTRGERLRRVVVSVPVSGGESSRGGRNQVGAFLISIPDRRPDETDRERLARLAVRTRRRKLLARGPSGSVALSTTLAVLGRLGWYRPMFERQRAITTLVTNLRGPTDPIAVQGVPVRSLTPISPTLGNVTIVFAAVSYAGRLRVTARLDRSVWSDQKVLADALQEALERLAAA